MIDMKYRAPARRWLAMALTLLALAVIGGLPARAQNNPPPQPTPGGPVTDDQVNAIAEQLYCPVCENIPLDVCGTQACADWRQEIRVMLAQGLTSDEITTRFAKKYGLRVLASPQRSGVNLAVWVLPTLGVVIGAIVVGVAIWRMAPGALAAQAKLPTSASYDDLDPEYVARLERELKEFSS